ncbi:phosphodiesterase [Rhizobium tubonense]|uniref:Phosphodiesterase n=1 Tax=Rhizobium tubonense TaxID=484088 RepID=A0A2W4CJU5_9HYPH|nr:phosphodiesterase [Rhizobium tubonense]PZM12961.1 phosphodiesterase [Rhizobium tubonense]
MKKLIQVTDPHLMGRGGKFHGIDPEERLRECLLHIAENHPDADAIIVTGDLADNGEVAAYQQLKELMEGLRTPIYLTLGNHDSRQAFRQVFGGSGFVNATFDLETWRIIVVDSKGDFSDCGSLDQGRLAWLEYELANAGDRNVILAMHHTPTNLHAPFFQPDDDLTDGEALVDLIKRTPAVKHMLFGHRHLTVGGSYAGISFSVCRGTSHHIALDLSQTGRSNFVAAPPSYDIVLLDERDVIVHKYYGLEQLEIIRPGDPK